MWFFPNSCKVFSAQVVEMVTKNPPYAELPQLSALYKIVADPHPPLPEGFSEEGHGAVVFANTTPQEERKYILRDVYIYIHKREIRSMEILEMMEMQCSSIQLFMLWSGRWMYLTRAISHRSWSVSCWNALRRAPSSGQWLQCFWKIHGSKAIRGPTAPATARKSPEFTILGCWSYQHVFLQPHKFWLPIGNWSSMRLDFSPPGICGSICNQRRTWSLVIPGRSWRSWPPRCRNLSWAKNKGSEWLRSRGGNECFKLFKGPKMS